MHHDHDERRHLHELLDRFDIAMLVTRTGDGEIRGRPMAIAELSEDDRVCFVTDIETSKVAEINGDHDVGVTLQSSSRFVSLSGSGRVVRDRDRIRALWRDSWRPWFPNGPESTDLVLIEVEPKRAEYWDQAGAKGLRYFVDLARKALRGEKKRGGSEPEVHAQVDLHG